jgi:hypothetical protein
MQINFEAVALKKANKVLEQYILSASQHEATNKVYKKEIFKESLWKKLIALFRKD